MAGGKGHQGGFNPFRDANGEFTSPESAGKPGRSREGGPGAWEAIQKPDMNEKIRAGAGRGTGGGGALKPAADDWSGTKDGAITLTGGQKGAGRTPLIVNKGTADAFTQAEGRTRVDGPSPERPPARLRISAETQRAIKELGPDWEPDVRSLYQNPVMLVSNMGLLRDGGHAGMAVARGILRDHGMLPEQASWKQVDDLLATEYSQATSEQRAWQKLRAMGSAVAAGEDLERVITTMNRNGPTQADMAIRIARLAGQAPDLDDPDIAVYDQRLATPD